MTVQRAMKRAVFNRDERGSQPCLLSILVPFYQTMPAILTQQLLHAAQGLESEIELLLADDGSGRNEYADRISGLLCRSAVPAMLIVLADNIGRAAIRNVLCREARGKFVLFVDGDVQVDHPDYLARYLTLIRTRSPDVAFGGFAMATLDGHSRELLLHQLVSNRSHCRPLTERNRQPQKYVYGSNLLVRRDLMADSGFDERFRGWGWEDVELGFRLGDVAHISQVDNPVVHHGYQAASTLIERWTESADNFQLLCAEHPEKAAALPIYRASALIARMPGLHRLRGALGRLVATERPAVPMLVRFWSWKWLRAMIYAERFRERKWPERKTR